MKYKYFEVSKTGCTPSTFAISENNVFVYNRDLGGAFKLPKTKTDVYAFFSSDPEFVVIKTNSALFDNIQNWFDKRDIIEYLGGVVA